MFIWISSMSENPSDYLINTDYIQTIEGRKMADGSTNGFITIVGGDPDEYFRVDEEQYNRILSTLNGLQLIG